MVQEAALYTIHAGQDGVNDLQWWPDSASKFGLATQAGNVEVRVSAFGVFITSNSSSFCEPLRVLSHMLCSDGMRSLL